MFPSNQCNRTFWAKIVVARYLRNHPPNYVSQTCSLIVSIFDIKGELLLDKCHLSASPTPFLATTNSQSSLSLLWWITSPKVSPLIPLISVIQSSSPAPTLYLALEDCGHQISVRISDGMAQVFQLILNSLLYSHIFAAWNKSSSGFRRVHSSQPYLTTGQTRHFKRYVFSSIGTLLSFHYN